jgi:hypothetical protein
MTDLSPAALAVWEAFNSEEPGVFVDYGDCLAAALRAAAAIPSASAPVPFAYKLRAIASELETSTTETR